MEQRSSSTVVDRYFEEFQQATTNGFCIAILVANECLRQGLVAMLSSAPSVKEVQIWDTFLHPSRHSLEEDFDVLIVRFGDLDIDDTYELSMAVRRVGKKVLLLLDQDEEEALDNITVIPGHGFILQEELTTAALTATIERITEGDAPMPATLANRLLTRAREGGFKAAPQGPNLTPRERQVLTLLVEGLSNKQIALRLAISQHGVKRLVSNVLAKLNCLNRTQAVAIALTDGVLTDPKWSAS